MKKLLVFGLAVLLVVAFCVPASALENVFGGYWRVRGFKQKDYDGQSDGTRDEARTDTRTRIYYTAILNDNLKLVNKFEMDATFGEQGGYGDFGADGVSVEVKNSYADFNTGPINWKLGVQGAVIGRGLVFDDDFAGAQAVYKADKWFLRGTWLKAYEGGEGTSQNKEDYDAVALEASFDIGELGNIRPFAVFSWSQQFQGGANTSGVSGRLPDGNDANIFWAGLDTDMTLGPVALFASFAYSGGSIDGQGGDDDTDLKGYVVVAGADLPLGPFTIHTQGFYASGDEAEVENGSDLNGYVGLDDSYYWSEIMGLGLFDNKGSSGSPENKLNNIWALNLGATIKPFDKLSIRGDVWYAAKPADDPITDEDELGTEVDINLTYEMIEGLNLQVVGAYLFADDATSDSDSDNDEDPWEIGFQTELSF